ncbi:lactate utilization protein [Gehongia tenuis]|nr:lactate utilization protein [Gehongia tenuis]
MKWMENLSAELEKRHYTVRCFENGSAAAKAALEELAGCGSVGIGGSMTVEKLGLYDALKDAGHEVYWHWKVPKEEMDAARQKALLSDGYLLSCNAITEDGMILNTDGTGNRIAASIFGTGKVIFLVGKNKLAKDVPAAMQRINTVACPLNARRLGLATPCAKSGECTQCQGPARMCNVTVIMEGAPTSHPVLVYLIDEELGY